MFDQSCLLVNPALNAILSCFFLCKKKKEKNHSITVTVATTDTPFQCYWHCMCQEQKQTNLPSSYYFLCVKKTVSVCASMFATILLLVLVENSTSKCKWLTCLFACTAGKWDLMTRHWRHVEMHSIATCVPMYWKLSTCWWITHDTLIEKAQSRCN